MAEYRVGAEGAYRGRKRYRDGEPITIPDAEKPSRTWFPVCEKAKAAFKKHHPDVRADLNKTEPVRENREPKTLFEAGGGKTRASDREPV